ncbi:PEPxxWA-CTERM sorting domain-containing protein [Phenylobacterium sp. LjRoot164]|uniref:PEPxxWA-CTERM sorting domain-containing protein n=1 Tax=unclassified Phenylobacterium TaxID=2640670 RepID=UPI003ECF1E76
MKLKSIFSGGAVLCALLSVQPANAATIVTQTTRAGIEAATGLSGGSAIDFESIATGFYSQISTGGVTFKTPKGALGVDTQYGGQFNALGKSLKSVIHSQVDIGFDEALTGFGFFFGASDLTWTLSAYDALGGLLESVQISPTGASNAGNFYGLKANGIRSARLTTTSADYVIIDDFRTSIAPLGPTGAVPEPATWAMMITGFGLTGAMVRRSRRSQMQRLMV